jgi:hypothetical protein
MVEAKIVPAVTAPAVHTVPVQIMTPTQMVDVPPVPEITISSSLTPTSKKGGKWGWILLGGIVIFVFRYEIGYYVFGKPNRKYPRY